HRGQIVVFYRDDEQHGEPLIKRVIGVPGDTISIQGGQVFVNGMLLDEPYVHGLLTDCSNVCGSVMLCADQYFVMGDNRTVSVDSREFGPISGSAIVGRVVARFWPLDSVALFP
ncbi:MAG TPA: signal peptidase I, partial [Roseiflexaceae bacterium]|nr:signal peptidase I [Roseiflexaceae bacterium]